MVIYLLEIRNRLILTFLTWLSLIIICYLYKETVLFLILQPNKFFESGTNFHSFYFIFTNVTEIFSAYMQLTYFLSTQIGFIYFSYHCFNFLSLALFNREYFLFSKFLKLSFIVWCFSVAITDYVIIPLTWGFFFSFQRLASDQFMSLHFEAKLNEYLNFYISLHHLCIFYCQIFTIIIILSFVSTNFIAIKKFRKLYYYVFVLFSTLVSPPDIISQVLISWLLGFSYEILIIIFVINYFLTRQQPKTNQNPCSENQVP